MAIEYSGAGDPKRSLELLWGLQGRPRRGPKPRLTVEVITRAAIELADAEGLAALSMRRVAGRLGVSVMSLYTYVPAKAELIDVMLDTVAGERPRLGEFPGGWRERLERWAREGLATYLRHRWILQIATVRPPMGPNEAAGRESALRALSGTGLTDREIVALLGCVEGYVRGMARTAVDAAQVEGRTGVGREHWHAARAPLLRRLIDPGRYPTLRSFQDADVLDDPADVFEFGLRRMLDGVERFLQCRTAPSAP